MNKKRKNDKSKEYFNITKNKIDNIVQSFNKII